MGPISVVHSSPASLPPAAVTWDTLVGKPTLLSISTSVGQVLSATDSRLSKAFSVPDYTLIGTSISTAKDGDEVRRLIHAGSSDFDGAYTSLTGRPTLLSIGTAALQTISATDSRLTDTRTPSAHTHPASAISDATDIGRSVLTAAGSAAVRTAIGAGVSNFDGAYGSLSGAPTLGSVVSLGTGTGVTDVIIGSDTRLTNTRDPNAHTQAISTITGLGLGVSTFLAAATSFTGSGAIARATSPTLVTPILGTPQSGTLSSCTAYPLNNLTGLGMGVPAALAAGTTATGGLIPYATSLPTTITGSSLTSTGTLTGGATGAGFTINYATSTNSGVLPFANGGIAGALAISVGSGAMSINMASAPIRTLTPRGACTFNATGGVAGQNMSFYFTTAGTATITLTWGTNFIKSATLATGAVAARFFAVSFTCLDGTTWFETGRTSVMS
jgi:hypothetical protein